MSNELSVLKSLREEFKRQIIREIDPVYEQFQRGFNDGIIYVCHEIDMKIHNIKQKIQYELEH